MRFAFLILLAVSLPCTAYAQESSPSPWQLRARIVLSGSSDTEDAASYKVYSGLGIEAAAVRDLGSTIAVETALRTESREVEGPRGPSGTEPLGSLEVLPISLTAQWRLLGNRATDTQPYVGAGVAVNLVGRRAES